MTFSIAARCAETGMFGIAISSSSPAVAARCAFAKAGVGAAASQNITNPALGGELLALMEAGQGADTAIERARDLDPHIDYRQLLCVDAEGTAAVFSGNQILGVWAEARGPNVATGGNLLAGEKVPVAMLDAFSETDGTKAHLADRLMIALDAGLKAGGEAGPVHSAGLKVVDRVPWPIVDLRVDWDDGCPITSLQTLWERYKPQMDDYVTRALDPGSAPAYGVPGDA